MSTLLKVLGWIFIFIAAVGGSQVLLREPTIWNFLALLVYVVLAWLCLWGSKKLKK